jgi:imidazolonepropionase
VSIKADFAVVNANELVTLKGNNQKPRTGEGLSDLAIIKDGAVAARDGRIVSVGTTEDVLSELEKGFEIVDASGKLVTPGLIDSHVHLVFGGSREEELEQMAVKRIPYLEILAKGGGMPTTLEKTGEASTEELLE